MSDPDRLLGCAGSIDARLLSAALDEPPPPDLLARTLVNVGVASGAAAAPVVASKLAVIKALGGGLVGALGAGVLAGVLAVGAFDLATSPGPEPARVDGRQEANGLRGAPAARAPVAPPAVASPLPPSEGKADVAPATAPSSPSLPTSPSTSAQRPPALAAEIALLDEARRALEGGEPARAKALMDRYAREMPRGQLAREAGLMRARVAQAVRAAPAAKEITNP